MRRHTECPARLFAGVNDYSGCMFSDEWYMGFGKYHGG